MKMNSLNSGVSRDSRLLPHPAPKAQASLRGLIRRTADLTLLREAESLGELEDLEALVMLPH